MRAKILNASAGAGKTYQLAYHYIRDVVDQPTIYRHILAVTFTNKATEEMKSRILKEIHALAEGQESSYLKLLSNDLGLSEAQIRQRAAEARSRILHDYSRFTVLTIDTFFQRILRAFIKELNLDLNYNIEIETDTVLDRSVDQLIESIASDEELRRWVIGYARERIDENARWDVRDSIGRLGAELFAETGIEAGSKIDKNELEQKMKAATARNCAIEQQMISVARRAQELMASRGLIASDFKNGSNSFANYFNAAATGFVAPSNRARKAAVDSNEWATKTSPRRADIEDLIPELQPLLVELCNIYDKNVRRYNATRLFRETYRSYALLADLYSKVTASCDEDGMILLSETKNLLSEFIEKNDAPFIYEKVGNRYEHFMIDEFQDTSRKEWRNFLPLLQNSLAQSERTPVLIVGDVKQSIYRWRGGDWQILARHVAEDLGPENIEQHSLTENRRSLPLVVQFNNAMIGRVVERDSEALISSLAEATNSGAIAASEAELLGGLLTSAYRGHSQKSMRKSTHEGYISITRYGVDKNDPQNSEPPIIACVERILSAGYRPSDIMILTRNKEDGKRVATRLLDYTGSNEARFRFDVITQDALTVSYDPVAGFIIACMRLAINPKDDLSRLTINKYLVEREATRSLDAELSNEEQEFFARMRSTSPEEAFEQIVMRFALNKIPEAVAYIQALHELVVVFCTNRVADIPLFLRWWDEKGHETAITAQENKQAIEISTIHKSKGLERKVVIIPYCNWRMDAKPNSSIWVDSDNSDFEGLGPIPLKNKSDLATSDFSTDYHRERVNSHIDNINLLYVALTRAKEQLHIMYPASCGSTFVGALINSVIEINGDSAQLATKSDEADHPIEGRVSSAENCQLIEFGEFAEPEPTHKSRAEMTERVILDDYPTRDTSSQLRLRLPMQRYFEQDGEVRLSPRNFGVAMHKVFEQATSTEDIYVAIDNMQRNSQLSDNECARLHQMIDEAMQNPLIAEWFEGEWSEVRNESSIIVPNGAMYRPDRVMIGSERTVVVDYKFGMEQKAAYTRQIAHYCELLRQMGYPNVEGYIWYIALGEVVAVEN